MQQFEITPQELEFLKQMRKQEETSEEDQEESEGKTFSVSNEGVGLAGFSVDEIKELSPVMITVFKCLSKLENKREKLEKEPAIGFITVGEEDEYEDDEDDWEE